MNLDERLEHEYRTSKPVTFEAQSAPEVVETVEIEGQPVAIVRYATLEMPTADSAPVFGRTDRFYAILAGAEVHPLSRSFYVNRGRCHEAGDATGGRTVAYVKGGELAASATVKAAVKAARDRVERDRLYAQYAPVAEKNIGSHTRGDFEALDADAEIQPGDLVVVVSHSKYRTGVAVKVTKTRVECLAATPTGGVANGATRTKGTQVRLLRQATPAAPAATRGEIVDPAEQDRNRAEHIAAARQITADASADPRTREIAEGFLVSVDRAEPRTQRRIPGGRPTTAQARFLAALPVDGSLSKDAMQAVSIHAPVTAAIARGWAVQEPWEDGSGRVQHRITPDGLWAIGREPEAAALRSVELAAAAERARPETTNRVADVNPVEAALEAAGVPLHRSGDGDPGDMSADAVAGRSVSLDAAEDRRAVAGRVFASSQGMGDAGAGCTLYRMVRARVGARQVRIHAAGGELLGTVTEDAFGWRAETPDGAVLPGPAGLLDGFADAVAAVRAAAAAWTDDQGATEAAREGEDMGHAESADANQVAELRAKLERQRVELRDARTDLLDVRGILSPNGYPPKVPVELVPAVAPAVRWLVDELERVRAELAELRSDPAGLRAVAVPAVVARGRAGHVTEIEVDAVGHFGWRCVRGDADQTGIEFGETAYAAATAHGPLAADSPFARGPVIVHQGRGDNEHGVPRRTLDGSLRFHPHNGEWWVWGYGYTAEVDAADIAGAQAFGAAVMALRSEHDGGPTVARWEHHRDERGEWWEPVTR